MTTTRGFCLDTSVAWWKNCNLQKQKTENESVAVLTNLCLYDRFPTGLAIFGTMGLFFDYLWIWIVLAFIVGIGGYVWYHNDPKGRNLIIAIASPILTLALGLVLYYGVDTDRKSIIRMLDALIAAVEADDPDAVCRFISPRAEDLQQFARTHMRTIDISRARYHNLEIEVNDATSPPIAHVRFSTIFHWTTKSPVDGFSFDPIPQRVCFEVELVKTRDRTWLLTNNFQYFPRGGLAQ